MTSDALVVSISTFKTLSRECQNELLNALQATYNAQPATETSEEEFGEPTQFSINEMRKFLDGISDKTRAFLKALSTLPSQFKVADLLDKLDVEYSEIRGILAGLTKRSRTISGDPEADFFASVVWDDDIRKCVSRIHPTTHASLRKLLKAGNS